MFISSWKPKKKNVWWNIEINMFHFLLLLLLSLSISISLTHTYIHSLSLSPTRWYYNFLPSFSQSTCTTYKQISYTSNNTAKFHAQPSFSKCGKYSSKFIPSNVNNSTTTKMKLLFSYPLNFWFFVCLFYDFVLSPLFNYREKFRWFFFYENLLLFYEFFFSNSFLRILFFSMKIVFYNSNENWQFS